MHTWNGEIHAIRTARVLAERKTAEFGKLSFGARSFSLFGAVAEMRNQR